MRNSVPDGRFESLRENVNPALRGLSNEQLAEVFDRQHIDAELVEGFFDDLGKFAAKAAPAVLPVAGQVIGGIYGGPAGAAIGGQLGSLAGGAISSATGQRPPSGPAGMSAPLTAAPPAAAMAPGAGSPAASQLLQTIMRPEVLQALASMAMGSLGKPNVAVGGTSVPVSAFSNLLGVLAGRAEAEYSESIARTQSSLPAYLTDYAGEAKVDPAIEEDRARALYELLSEQLHGEATESEGESESEMESAEAEAEAEADAAELLDLAYELNESEWD